MEIKLYVPHLHQEHVFGVGNIKVNLLVEKISCTQARCVEFTDEKIVFDVLQEEFFPILKLRYEYYFSNESNKIPYMNIEPGDFFVIQKSVCNQGKLGNSVTTKYLKDYVKDFAFVGLWSSIFLYPKIIRKKLYLW